MYYRTSFSLEQRSLSWCLSDDDDNKYNISFPDLSGETFQKQYVDREIDSVLAKMIIASDGLILFINPQGIIEPTLISQLPLSLREDEKNDTSPKERNQKIDDPTVVQIIVLLQDIAYLLKGKRMPLVVIVSAWDVVENSFTTPEDFVMKHTSLDSVVSLNLFISVVRVLDPYCDRTLSEAQRWENYYNRFSKDNRWKEYKAEYAQFVLPIILRSENSFSSDFLQFSFSTVHTLLANDEMEYNKWEQLSNLLPEVAWYNSWDKCKRLRKAAKQRSLSIDFSRKNKDGK